MDIPFITSLQIASTLDIVAQVAHLRLAHQQPAPDAQRLYMQQPVPGGLVNGFLIWPAWQPGRNLGIKICTLFPQNRQQPTVQALYALFDGGDGHLQALIDGAEMTYWKTAADSALGADLLARQDASTLLVVGAGSMAPQIVRAYRAIRPGLSRVRVWNRTHGRAQALVDSLQGIAAEVLQDLDAAVHAADIVCCVTASTSALVCGDCLRPGTHVDLIGGYTPQMREADDAAMRRARIFVDSRWFTVAHVGDLTQPLTSGAIAPHDVLGDLFELSSGQVPGRQNAWDITLFKSGGGAHLDLMTAQHIAEQLL